VFGQTLPACPDGVADAHAASIHYLSAILLAANDWCGKFNLDAAIGRRRISRPAVFVAAGCFFAPGRVVISVALHLRQDSAFNVAQMG
jgi:hypothetical protein